MTVHRSCFFLLWNIMVLYTCTLVPNTYMLSCWCLIFLASICNTIDENGFIFLSVLQPLRTCLIQLLFDSCTILLAYSIFIAVSVFSAFCPGFLSQLAGYLQQCILKIMPALFIWLTEFFATKKYFPYNIPPCTLHCRCKALACGIAPSNNLCCNSSVCQSF